MEQLEENHAIIEVHYFNSSSRIFNTGNGRFNSMFSFFCSFRCVFAVNLLHFPLKFHCDRRDSVLSKNILLVAHRASERVKGLIIKILALTDFSSQI